MARNKQADVEKNVTKDAEKGVTKDVEKEEQVVDTESGGDLLTVREVARHLRVDDTTVRRWIKSGALDAVALPHSGKRCGYRVRRYTLDALFNTSNEK